MYCALVQYTDVQAIEIQIHAVNTGCKTLIAFVMCNIIRREVVSMMLVLYIPVF